MKNFLISILFMLTTLPGLTQNQDPVFLWPDKVPGETDAKHEPVQTSNKDGDVIRLTDVTNPAYFVFKPEPAKNNGTGIVVCPGGGYNILAFNKEGTEIAEWLTKLGFTAFVLQYRVPKKQDGALMDAQRAISLIRQRATNYGIKGDKIGIMGFSAGGSLSARSSTLYQERSYSPTDQADTISCRPDFALLIYPAYLDLGPGRTLTSELIVTQNTPPMFLFATADDTHGNSALVMARALRDAKVPVELHFMARGGHGYGLRQGNSAGETWPGLAEKWLREIIH